MRYAADIARTGVAGGRPFIEYRVASRSSVPKSVFDGAAFPSSNDEPEVPLLDVAGLARYRHDGTRFVLDPVAGAWTQGELDGATGHAYRGWVELNRAALVRVARAPGRARELLRMAFSDHCKDDGEVPSCASTPSAREIAALVR